MRALLLARVPPPIGLQRAVHLGLFFVLIGVAILLALPIRTFYRPAYDAFAYLGSEDEWAVFYVGASVFAAWGCVTRRWAVRIGCALLVGLTHQVTACLFILGNPATLAVVGFTFPACLAWYLAWGYRHAPHA